MEYTSKAKTTKVTALSRVSIKIKDNFYTVEYSEERSIPDTNDIDIVKERDILFDDVNSVVDKQVEDIIKTFMKK